MPNPSGGAYADADAGSQRTEDPLGFLQGRFVGTLHEHHVCRAVSRPCVIFCVCVCVRGVCGRVCARSDSRGPPRTCRDTKRPASCLIELQQRRLAPVLALERRGLVRQPRVGQPAGAGLPVTAKWICVSMTCAVGIPRRVIVLREYTFSRWEDLHLMLDSAGLAIMYLQGRCRPWQY